MLTTISRKVCYGPPKQGYAEKRKKKLTYVHALKWNESLHPRNPAGSGDKSGEFTSSREAGSVGGEEGKSTLGSGGGSRGRSVTYEEDVTPLTPAQKAMQQELARRDAQPTYIVNTPDEAVELILAGKNVGLKDTKAVHTVLKSLAKKALEAERLKSKAVTFDPCTITVKGTSLFCNEKLKTEKFPNGVPRIEMPQFKSKNPTPGSEADKLPRNAKGEVEALPVFLKHLADEMGVSHFSNGKMLARKLKASQAEMGGTQVAGMMLNKKFDPKKQRIVVSSDGYVVDGHHTWAAAVGRDAKDGNLDNDKRMEVVIIDMPMSKIYHIAKAWTVKYGLPATAVRKWERILKFNMNHDAKGLFASAPGGTMATQERPGLRALVEKLQIPNEGFTVHPATGEQPTTGFALSIYKGRETIIPVDKLTPMDLVKHVRANMDLLSQDGNFIGAWHNPENHKVYLDVSRVEPDKAKAVELAKAHDQIAIFNLEDGTLVDTKKALL